MKGEAKEIKRDFPYSRSGWASVVRNAPTAHEYRSRKNAMLAAIAMILYVGLNVSLKSGTYGIINISNVVTLEISFYISFLWCIYRFRVVCFDRIAEWDEKVITVINQNISVTGTRSWIDMRDRFLNATKDIDDKTRSRIDENIGNIEDFLNHLKA